MNKPQYIIVHHTGGTATNPLADTSHHTYETVRHWHVHGRGWDDIGYHYFIEKDGSTRKGRPENMHGAHAKGYNTKSIGICLAGNFDATMPTDAQIASLRVLLQDVGQRYRIDPENVIPHRLVANKTCYGMNLDDDWAQELYLEGPDVDQCQLSAFTTNELLKELLSRFGL